MLLMPRSDHSYAQRIILLGNFKHRFTVASSMTCYWRPPREEYWWYVVGSDDCIFHWRLCAPIAHIDNEIDLLGGAADGRCGYRK